MARRARSITPGLPHHIVHFGRGGRLVFRGSGDYERYLHWLSELAPEGGLKVWAYCLLPTHVHLIVVPESRRALGVTLRTLHTKHSQWLDISYPPGLHGWESRYGSAVIEEQLAEAVRYVERNPVRAGKVKRAEDYPWSSAAGHCGVREDGVLDPGMPLVGKVPDWSLWLWSRENQEVAERLRGRTHPGGPAARRPSLG